MDEWCTVCLITFMTLALTVTIGKDGESPGQVVVANRLVLYAYIQ